MGVDAGPVWDGDGARLERARAIGLFRYQLIREAADPGVAPRARGRMVRALTQATHVDPFGRRVRVSRASLDRWIRAWRTGGFEALVPVPRKSALRTDAEVLDLAAALRRENPERTCAQVERILIASLGWSPSPSTLLRHFHRLGLQPPAGAAAGTTVFGRFEADRPNQLWTGDALHGPKVAGRKTYLFAFIDDHSRLLVGYRWGFAEDAVRLAAALRPALAARGVPEAVYVDNGSAFVDAWLLRACAKLGIRLTHSTPGRPQGRGKIERVFRTVNDQFVVELARTDSLQTLDDPQAGLLEINRLFTGWVEKTYHHAIHSETGQSPLARWQAGWADSPPATPDPPTLREAFLWEERRTVTKTATVSLHGNTYQVDPALTGRKVDLVFDPFDLTQIEVRYAGRPMGAAVPHRIARHTHPKARPEIPAPDPPAATGIDFLNLIADSDRNDLAEAINFDALLTPTTPTDPTSDPTIDTISTAEQNPPGDRDHVIEAARRSAARTGDLLTELDAGLTRLIDTPLPHQDPPYSLPSSPALPDEHAPGPPRPTPDEQIPGQLDLTDLLTTTHPDDSDDDRPDDEETSR